MFIHLSLLVSVLKITMLYRGMIAPYNDPQGTCLIGYQGILCADCEPGYSTSSAYKCNKCPEFTTNVFRISAIFVAAIVVLSIMIRSTLKGAGNVKNVTSVF